MSSNADSIDAVPIAVLVRNIVAQMNPGKSNAFSIWSKHVTCSKKKKKKKHAGGKTSYPSGRTRTWSQSTSSSRNDGHPCAFDSLEKAGNVNQLNHKQMHQTWWNPSQSDSSFQGKRKADLQCRDQKNPDKRFWTRQISWFHLCTVWGADSTALMKPVLTK